MRRIAIGLGAALGLAALGWAGVWWTAAQAVADGIDARIAALRTAGVDIAIRDRSSGGFPLRVEHRFRGVEVTAGSGLWRLALDEVTSGAPVLAPERLRTALGPAGGAEMQRIGLLELREGGVPVSRLAIGARGLVIEVPLAEGAAVADFVAEALSLVDGGGPALIEGIVDLHGLAGRVERHAIPAVAENGHHVAFEAARLALAVAPRTAGPIRRSEIAASGVRFDAALAGLRGADLAAALSAPGQLAIGLEADEADIRDLTYTGGDPSGSVDFEALPVARFLRLSGVVSQRLTVADGRLAVEGSGRALTLDLAQPEFGGRFGLASASARFLMPLRETALPEPFGLEVSVQDAAPDADTWAALDPAGRLVRGPVTLTVDVTGEARLRAPLAGAQTPGASPIRVERIAVNRIAFEGFGGEAELSGELVPVPGRPEPDGRLSARVEGWKRLLGALESIGALDPAQSMQVTDVARRLLDPADPEALAAELEMDGGSVVVNGQRFR